MEQPKTEYEQETREAKACSRRAILKGSAAFIAGGIAGGIGGYAGLAHSAQRQDAPPPLPWKWPKLDPLEAGTRAYENYLKNKG